VLVEYAFIYPMASTLSIIQIRLLEKGKLPIEGLRNSGNGMKQPSPIKLAAFMLSLNL
jgi:hypothetical protein